MPSAPTSRSASTLRPSLKCAITARAVLLEALQAHAAVIVRRRKGVAQDAIEPLPGGQRLRAIDLDDGAALGIEDFPASSSRRRDRRCRCRARAWPAARSAARRCRRRGRTARSRPARRYRPQSRAPAAAGPRTGRSSSRRSRWPVFPRSVGAAPGHALYCANKCWRNAMALTMLDKKAVNEDRGEWPAEIKAEFERESRQNNGCVGSQLLSETDKVRIWIIRLAAGRADRLPPPCAQLFLDLGERRPRPPAPDGRHDRRAQLLSRRDAARDLRRRASTRSTISRTSATRR